MITDFLLLLGSYIQRFQKFYITESQNYFTLKLVSAIFYQFIFSPNESPPKTMTSVFCFI